MIYRPTRPLTGMRVRSLRPHRGGMDAPPRPRRMRTGWGNHPERRRHLVAMAASLSVWDLSCLSR
jgi:hypothetical protein